MDRLFVAAPSAHLLIVDDGSPDGTRDLADKLAETDSRVDVMHRRSKSGLGAAYLAGFDWARARDYDAVVEMDSDGSHAPAELPLLLTALTSRVSTPSRARTPSTSDTSSTASPWPTAGTSGWRPNYPDAPSRWSIWSAAVRRTDCSASSRRMQPSCLSSRPGRGGRAGKRAGAGTHGRYRRRWVAGTAGAAAPDPDAATV